MVAIHQRVNMFQMLIFFYFDLTCEVISDHKFNKIKFCSTTLAGLSNAVLILKIGTVVLEIGGGLILAPQWGAL